MVETDKSIQKRQLQADEDADMAGVDLSRLKEDQRLLKKQVEFQKEQEKIKKKIQAEAMKSEMNKQKQEMQLKAVKNKVKDTRR